jgi:hypothetical protein
MRMNTPQRYSDAEICKLLHYWDGRYPEALTLDLFCRETGIGGTTIQRRFGGWLALRQAAGLERRKSHLVNGRVHSAEELVRQLQMAAKKFSPNITQHLFCQWLGTAPSTLKAHCGSWRKLRRAAGLPERVFRQPEHSNNDLLWELNRLVQTLKMWPTANQISRCGRFSYATYAGRFGRMAFLRLRFQEFVRRERERTGHRNPPESADWRPTSTNRGRCPRGGWFLDFPPDGCPSP